MSAEGTKVILSGPDSTKVVFQEEEVEATPGDITKVVTTGAIGPKGEKGDAGDQGPAGSHYVHSQNAPSVLWTINHNLGTHPNITAIDSGGSEILGQIVYVDLNTVTMTFSSSISGFAYLS